MVDILSLRDEIIMRQAAGEEMPSPPFPTKDDLALQIVFQGAMESLDEGVDPVEIIIWAAVHGWYEGYLNAVDGPLQDI